MINIKCKNEKRNKIKLLVRAVFIFVSFFVSPHFSKAETNNSFDSEKLARARAIIAEKDQAVTHDLDTGVTTTGIKILQALALCVGIFLVGSFVAKKLTSRPNKNGSSREIQIIERLNISPKLALLLVEINGNRFLVGQGAESISISKIGEGITTENYQTVQDECAREMQ